MSHAPATARSTDFASIAQISFPPAFGNSELSHRERELVQRETLLRSLTSRLVQSQEHQRLHLARELHDDIAQRLALATSELAALSEQVVESSIVKDRLAVVLGDLRGLCTDVHLMSHGLHSFKLEYLGLHSALSELCKRHSRKGFEVILRANEKDNPHSKEVSLCLYRVAQEALANASKHSQSGTVLVTVVRAKHTVSLTVEDIGIGFDERQIAHGLGLLSMGERVSLAGGQLTVRSVMGSGTKILAKLSDKEETRNGTST